MPFSDWHRSPSRARKTESFGHRRLMDPVQDQVQGHTTSENPGCYQPSGCTYKVYRCQNSCGSPQDHGIGARRGSAGISSSRRSIDYWFSPYISMGVTISSAGTILSLFNFGWIVMHFWCHPAALNFSTNAYSTSFVF